MNIKKCLILILAMSIGATSSNTQTVQATRGNQKMHKSGRSTVTTRSMAAAASTHSSTSKQPDDMDGNAPNTQQKQKTILTSGMKRRSPTPPAITSDDEINESDLEKEGEKSPAKKRKKIESTETETTVNMDDIENQQTLNPQQTQKAIITSGMKRGPSESLDMTSDDQTDESQLNQACKKSPAKKLKKSEPTETHKATDIAKNPLAAAASATNPVDEETEQIDATSPSTQHEKRKTHSSDQDEKNKSEVDTEDIEENPEKDSRKTKSMEITTQTDESKSPTNTATANPDDSKNKQSTAHTDTDSSSSSHPIMTDDEIDEQKSEQIDTKVNPEEAIAIQKRQQAEQLLKQKPEEYSANMDVHEATEETRQRLSKMTRIIKSNPELPQKLFELGNKTLDKNKIIQAQIIFDYVIIFFKYFALYAKYQLPKKEQTATQNNTHTSNPTDTTLRHIIAEQLFQTGRDNLLHDEINEAREAFSKAALLITYDQRIVSRLYQLGTNYMQAEKLFHARIAFEAYLKFTKDEHIANQLYNIWGTEKTLEDLIYLSNLGSTRALTDISDLGQHHLHGIGSFPKNEKQAIETFKLIEKLEIKEFSAYGKYMLGMCYLNTAACKNENQALAYLKDSANLNYTEAKKKLCQLGIQYLNGTNNFPKDEKRAIEIFKIIAKIKDKQFASIGNYNLGMCYLNGIGVKRKNEDQAIKYFLYAANNNHHQAQNELYKLVTKYLNGTEGTPKNEKRAIEILERIRTQIDSNMRLDEHDFSYIIKYSLAMCYLKITKTPKDNQNAIDILKKLANIADWTIAQLFNIQSGSITPQTIKENLDSLNTADIPKMPTWNKIRAFYNPAPLRGKATYRLAMCYLNGIGVPKDEKMALFYLLIASKYLNNSDAHYLLGTYYLEGTFVNKNPEMAVHHLQRVSPTNKLRQRANYLLGRCYLFGDGVLHNTKIAVKYFNESPNVIKTADVLYRLGMCYLQGTGGVSENTEKAVAYFKEADQLGWVPAQFSLGLCYLSGNGVPKDETKAMECFDNAKKNGYPTAIKAIEYFKTSDYPTAIYKLGIDHINGINEIPQNLNNAVECLLCAMKLGYVVPVEQIYNLGLTNLQNSDEEKAILLFKVAAKAGYIEAKERIFNLGIIYLNKPGDILEYEEKAIQYFTLAAELGYPEAIKTIFQLGSNYIKNAPGVATNHPKAVKYLKIAAKFGHRTAMMHLGYCYACGKGIQQNFKKAAKWYHTYINQYPQPEVTSQKILDPVKRTNTILEKIENFKKSELSITKFILKYFNKHFNRLYSFMQTNQISNAAILQHKLENETINTSTLNKLLSEAEDALKCAQFIYDNAAIPGNSEALDCISRLMDTELNFQMDQPGIVLTENFLNPYTISPWRSCIETNLRAWEITANMYGAEFDKNLVHYSTRTQLENMYDYIFKNNGINNSRFQLLSQNLKELLAREMHWFRCMNEKYKSGKLTDEAKLAFEKCKNLAEVHFASATGACHNELADILILWAKDIDDCENSMGIGTRIDSQNTFDEIFTTSYRQYLAEKTLSNEYVDNAQYLSDSMQKLKRAFSTNINPEYRNFYRFLVSHLLNVIPTCGTNLAVDHSITNQDIVNVVSQAIQLKDMCEMAQKIYQGLADENDAQADDAALEPIKVTLAKNIESKFAVSYSEFCKIIDMTHDMAHDTSFAERLTQFIDACNKDARIDKEDDDFKTGMDEIQKWMSGAEQFTIEQLIKIILNIDIYCYHTELIPELCKFGAALSRSEKSAEYYAKVLYPIYLLKTDLIKINI